jgi:predicted DCC family thiol-disulfide oxidoreductase YuxK
MSNDRPMFLVYDGECPFCSAYAKLVRLREATGTLTFVNARDDHPMVRFVEQRGVTLDQEMALVIGDDVYSGGDCINRLAMMSTRSGLFNRINAALFSSRTLSQIAYPFLRCGRNLALKALGRSQIRTHQR